MSLHPLSGRRATLGEYHSLLRDGVLREGDRVQLLGGMIVAMTPQGAAHARVIRTLDRHFQRTVGDDAAILVQMPLTLVDDSEPEPDLALVTPEEAARRDGHPRSAVLVVEVAGDSLRQDRCVKAAIYARAAIPEYWIVNLDEDALEVYRHPDPHASTYATVLRMGAADVVTPLAFPAASLRAGQIFD